MKILFVNPILYTSEYKKIAKRTTIADTLSFGLCSEFAKEGHDITLYASEDFMPTEYEKYPFQVIFEKPIFKKIFFPNVFPYLPKLASFLRKNKFDFIICSECFSLNTLNCVLHAKNVIIWQELAALNKFGKKIPAFIWYNFIVRFFYGKALIIPRSNRARIFISKYSKNISFLNIDHGVDLQKFFFSQIKNKYFIVVSQLIKRKRIDKTIEKFHLFCEKYSNDYKLVIIGNGIEYANLMKLVKSKNISNIEFKGFLSHDEVSKYYANSTGLLIYTEKDDNMITIDEALASCCPILTTSVPFLSDLIKSDSLGIVKDEWNEDDLNELVINKDLYFNNCMKIRNKMGYDYTIDCFIKAFKSFFNFML